MTVYVRKLIEVALPLEAINRESINEKSVPRKGHPATMHLWWARRPLASCRSVILASLLCDPEDPNAPPEYLAEIDKLDERFGTKSCSRVSRLFSFIEALVKWENLRDQGLLQQAKKLIAASTNNKPPAIVDPFCGGGSIPLEAARLGLPVRASDLNPVAVLITKALIELPGKFGGKAAVNPQRNPKISSVTQSGLAEDVRYYGKIIRDKAEAQLRQCYPQVDLPTGGKGTVIAWLWARTVKCPNPACGGQMPLVRSFALSTKKGREAHVVATVQGKKVRFSVSSGKTKQEGTVNRRGAKCLICGSPVPFDYIRNEGKADKISEQLLAIVAEGPKGRAYVSPDENQERIAREVNSDGAPEAKLPTDALGFRVQLYGMSRYRDLFSDRQLAALVALSDNIIAIREKIVADALSAKFSPDKARIDQGGTGAEAYADAVVTYLAFALSKQADWCNSLSSYIPAIEGIGHLFVRHTISMCWDYCETNPFSNSAGNFLNHLDWVACMVEASPANPDVVVEQSNATDKVAGNADAVVVTDPPYYDNIGYADLSDFFYVWLRRSLVKVYPSLFSTLLVPKEEELIAAPHRFNGSRDKAQEFFEKGLGVAFQNMRKAQDPRYPMPIFYAFKQSETDEEDDDTSNGAVVASTGWETMLEGLLKAGFRITGTWPMRTERSARTRSQGSNALASSIVLVCRPRSVDASISNRRDFVSSLKKEVSGSIASLIEAGMAPVDLAQSSIGPGMAVFSAHSSVLDFDGKPMSVRAALKVINQELDEYLSAHQGDLDRESQLCISWFEQHGLDEGLFGEADVLARAKNTSVDSLVDAGVVHSRAGKVRLLKRTEYPTDWDPATDRHLITWECTQHLIRKLLNESEDSAAALINALGSERSEEARSLAYRLYSICDRNGWTDEAFAYNTLVLAWPGLMERAAAISRVVQQTISI